MVQSSFAEKERTHRGAAEEKTQLLITEVLRPFFPRLRELAGTVLTVLEEALRAKKTDDADHRSRLKAVERYCDLLQLAQGKVRPRPVETKPVSEMTWEEFVVM